MLTHINHCGPHLMEVHYRPLQVVLHQVNKTQSFTSLTAQTP